MGNGRHGSTGISKNVESQMGHFLSRVREKNMGYENRHEYHKESDSDEQEDLQYYEEEGYLDEPSRRWEVPYDNQNYIQSMVNEDKGLHRIADYPKRKWEICCDNRARVENLEPYPVRVSVDHGHDEIAQWDVPYDNKNYVLSMLAGSGVSKTWEEDMIDVERIKERHGNLRNPYDYDSAEDEVIPTSYRERRPRRESYRFDRVERNVHDYESDSVPEDEVTQPHVRDQRRRSTNIYRYGDVERNVHDVAAQRRFSRSPSRRGISAQKGTKTRYDAINKWKSAMQSSNYEKQNAYNEDLERHYNQYGVEASAHDYDEQRAIRTADVRKRIVPMSFVNVVRKPGPQKSGRLKQVAERYRNQRQDNVPVHRELYERAVQDYGDHDYDHIPVPGSLCEDIIEEHKDHPYDYGSRHEDSYEEYKEGEDGSQTWMSSSEKYAQIHHRSQ